jgi:hypothetical protein
MYVSLTEKINGFIEESVGFIGLGALGTLPYLQAQFRQLHAIEEKILHSFFYC